MKVVQKTDVYVGLFLVITIGIVVGALIATSGWGTRHFDLYIRTQDVADVAIDSKIFLQGLEVGRVAAIDPRRTQKPGRLDFVIRASMLAQFADKTALHLPCGADAEVQSGFLGGSWLNVHVDSGVVLHHWNGRPCTPLDSLLPSDTIAMHRQPAAMAAFANLATDLKDNLATAINAATQTLVAYRHLADSLSRTSGSAHGLIDGIRPGTEATLAEVTASLARIRRLLDTTDVRTGVTMHQVDLTLEQSRASMAQANALMRSADSLTKLLTAMGGENRPEIRAMLLDARFLTQQLQYVMEQISRRPMRAMSGVQLPDSLTAEGHAQRLRADSIQRADSLQRAAPRDTSKVRRP